MKAARDLVTAIVREYGLDEHADDAGLVISEIAGNAIRASEESIGVGTLITGEAILILCWDSDPTVPEARVAADSDETGRGLFIVESLANKWGATRLLPGEGKVVWAILKRKNGQFHSAPNAGTATYADGRCVGPP